MAAVTAGLVKELRELTGAGMMDCKKALGETDGNMDGAIEYLRKNGQMKAEKKAGRIAAEGLVNVLVKDDKSGVVAEVNSETDFVAKNEDFQAFVAAVTAQALAGSSDGVEGLLAEPWNADPSKTVKDALTEKVAVIGENLSIRRFAKLEANDGIVVSYLHGGGRIGVLVQAKTDVVNDSVKEALVNVAMQIAALAPAYVHDGEIDEAYKAHEKEILWEQAKIENAALPAEKQKPENILEKMLIGRLNKQLKEICLLSQAYVKDNTQTVDQYLASVAKENGAKLSVVRFVRYETGEGIEKKEENFAEEVARQMGQ